jgi:hypothetical protein
MSPAAPDLIDGYLAELHAGLRIPAAEAELILAEAEDHLRETAAAGQQAGMNRLEAQQAAISSFGPVRAVVRAHRRRPVTAGEAAMAAWKLAALLATAVGVGGIVGLGIFQFDLRSAPGGGLAAVPRMGVVYAAVATGGLVLLGARWLARRGTSGRDPLSPAVTASCFLLTSALLWVVEFVLRAAPAPPPGPIAAGPNCEYSCNWGPAPVPGAVHGSGPGPAVTVLVVYAAMVACVLVLLAARRLGRRGFPVWDPRPRWVTASCFLLASAPLLALVVSGVRVTIAPVIMVNWLTPVSAGSVSAAPLVSGAVVAGCLAVAAGYGAQAAFRRARSGLRSGALRRVLVPPGRGGAGRVYA